MTIPVWPASLPQEPLLEGYRETPAVRILEVKMDAGAPKRRGRRGRVALALTMDLTRAQRVTLLDFFDNVLGGAAAFSWVHPVTRAPVVMAFVKAPAITPVSRQIFRARLDLEVR